MSVVTTTTCRADAPFSVQSMTEQPHKLPYYAALLLLLSRDQYRIEIPSSLPIESSGEAQTKTEPAGDVVMSEETPQALTEDQGSADLPAKPEAAITAADNQTQARPDVAYEPKISLQVLEYLEKRFQSYMQELDWLKIRLSVCQALERREATSDALYSSHSSLTSSLSASSHPRAFLHCYNPSRTASRTTECGRERSHGALLRAFCEPVPHFTWSKRALSRL